MRVGPHGASAAEPKSSLVIELEGLRKKFGQVPVLDGVNLRLESGGYLAVGGQSGAGKTTLLSIVGLLEPSTAGAYRFHGEFTGTLGDRELSKIRARSFGFVFQQFSLLPNLSAWQNVARPLLYSKVPRREHKPRALELLDRMGLSARSNHKPAQLSGGEQQRVAIARALINDPEVILADEPTGNLPRSQWEGILDAFDVLHAAGKTIILVTHNPTVAKRAARVLWLRDGKLAEAEEATTLSDPISGSPPRVVFPGGSVGDTEVISTGLRLEVLGRQRVLLDRVLLDAQPRQMEILILLAANPSGLSGEELALLVYGESGKVSTVKAALSKLRKLIPIDSRPYRLGVAFQADFLDLQVALLSGDFNGALQLYRGSLLPGSEASGIGEVRVWLDAALREGVLASGRGELAFQLAEVLGDDLELWEAAASRLDVADPRRVVASARAEQVRSDWG